VFRNQKYRLYPTPEQAEKLAQFVGTVRFIYNLALEQRRDFHRQFKRATGRSLNYITQGLQLTDLRREFPWIAETPANCQHGALQDLDKAFAVFFRGGGFPAFRKAGVNESYEIKAAETGIRTLNAKWAQLKMPKIGWVKFRRTRAIEGEVRNVRVVLDLGKWYVCVGVRNEHEAPASALPAVGVDRGVKLALALSDGQTFTIPDQLAAIDRRARHAQRILSRRKLGSVRYAEQRHRVASLKGRAGRVRSDWQHKSTGTLGRSLLRI
jgi:putative transposase